MKQETLIKVIDYCIEKPDDLCGKCVYAKAFEDVELVTGCEAFDKDGNVACRNGLIKHFEENE